MRLPKLLAAPVTYRLWHPRHLRLVWADATGASFGPALDRRQHLEAAIAWLSRAQDRRGGQADAGGVSAGWSFEDGWLPSYPETSGYIVETFVAAAEVLNRPDLRQRAGRIIDWELSIQNADGSFPGHFGETGSRPVVFNTGQIIHGMVAGFLELGRGECLEAAVRAGRWMAACQDEDGCWRRNVHNGVPHTYNTRAAWGMLRAGLLAADDKLTQAARRSFEWALRQQTESGWYRSNGFTAQQVPFTHTIAYAIRGLLEGGALLKDERFVASAGKAAAALAERQRSDGWLAGTYDDGWTPRASYCCLTGVAQMALNWQRLQHLDSGDGAADRTTPAPSPSERWQPHIDRALDYLKRRQRLPGDGTPQDGSIAGSFPIWGGYSRFEFPNWATKFYADALMMEMTDLVIPQPPVQAREDGPGQQQGKSVLTTSSLLSTVVPVNRSPGARPGAVSRD